MKSKKNITLKCNELSEDEKVALIRTVRNMQRKRKRDKVPRLHYKMTFTNGECSKIIQTR